jgi:hypothetical protein
VNHSMPREQPERYNAAFWYAVHKKDLRLETADDQAGWKLRSVGTMLRGASPLSMRALLLRCRRKGDLR